MEEKQQAIEQAGMALVMGRILGAGMPPEILGWMSTERGVTEVRCHFRRTWRALEAETWRQVALSLTPTPAEQLIKIVEDVARELWVAMKR